MQERMADPEISGNNVEYKKLVRAVSDMSDAVDGYTAYKGLERQLAEAKDLLRECDGALLLTSLQCCVRCRAALHRAVTMWCLFIATFAPLLL